MLVSGAGRQHIMLKSQLYCYYLDRYTTVILANSSRVSLFEINGTLNVSIQKHEIATK